MTNYINNEQAIQNQKTIIKYKLWIIDIKLLQMNVKGVKQWFNIN